MSGATTYSFLGSIFFLQANCSIPRLLNKFAFHIKCLFFFSRCCGFGSFLEENNKFTISQNLPSMFNHFLKRGTISKINKWINKWLIPLGYEGDTITRLIMKKWSENHSAKKGHAYKKHGNIEAGAQSRSGYWRSWICTYTKKNDLT